MWKLRRMAGGVLRDIWAQALGVLAFLALWQWGHAVYGPFILPSPLESVQALWRLCLDGQALPAVWATTRRALAGFFIAGLGGSALGVAAGLSPNLARALRPVVAIFLGVPPIAWIVLALIWFGSGDMAPVFTVAVTTFPITFAGAAQGARTLDRNLEDMARSFGAPPLTLYWDVRLPHIFSYLFPEWVTALGISWKVAVMAELLGAADGIGAGMAMARVNLETSEAMAWIIAVVAMLLAAQHVLLEPLKRRMEPWRKPSAAAS